jgi:LysM repeat protein
MKKILLTLVLFVAAVACFRPALAQDEEPTVYVIKKGDTLWGLSDRFIKDPYYWPNLWANNPPITNPHLIFPGQKVKIYSDRIVIEPAVPPEQPAMPEAAVTPAAKAPAEEMAPAKTFTVRGATGFLMEKEVSAAGYIIATHQNRHIVGEDDIVYTDIGKAHGGKVGDRFSIFKNMGAVSHPVTNVIMGYKIIPLGALQLSELEDKTSRAIVTKSFLEIEPGSFLLPYRDRRREVALKAAAGDLSGYIIETQTGNKAIAAGDVAFLDLGTSQGVEVGNMLYVAREVVPDQQYVHGTVDKLPEEVVGAVVVVETGAKTSTALVVKSIDTIYIGDRVELKKSK